MRLAQKIISAGFATAALASASLPALSFSVWPDVDFEGYNVGKPVANAERRGSTGQEWVAGRWIRDDFHEQVAAAAGSRGTSSTTGPLTLRDRDGNVIPTDPAAYPVDSARR